MAAVIVIFIAISIFLVILLVAVLYRKHRLPTIEQQETIYDDILPPPLPPLPPRLHVKTHENPSYEKFALTDCEAYEQGQQLEPQTLSHTVTAV